MEEVVPVWEGSAGNNMARVVVPHAGYIKLDMKTPSGRWTNVQTYMSGNGSHSITRSGAFIIPSGCMSAFLHEVLNSINGGRSEY